MNLPKLKILCELGREEQRALLVEFPKEVIQGLDIAADGTVDTSSFLEVMMQYYGTRGEVTSEDETYTSIMRAIFDSSIGVEEHPNRMLPKS